MSVQEEEKQGKDRASKYNPYIPEAKTIDKDRDVYIEKHFQIHSRISNMVRERIRKKKEQATDLMTLWKETYDAWPKWVRYLIAIPSVIVVSILMMAALNGLIKAEFHEFMKFGMAIMLIAVIIYVQKYLLVF